MSILTLFVVIPALMLLGLWLAKNLYQVRGVMVAGASCLLALSIWLTIYFIQQRAGGNEAEMLLTYSTPWFRPLNIAYSVGGDAAPVEHHRVHRYLRLLAAQTAHQGVLPLVHVAVNGCLWLLHQHRSLHDVYVLRGGSDSDVPVDRCLGFRP